MNNTPTYTLWWIRNLAEWHRFARDGEYLAGKREYLEKTVERVLATIDTNGIWQDGSVEPRLCDLEWAEGSMPLPGGRILSVRAVRRSDGLLDIETASFAGVPDGENGRSGGI